MRITGRPEASAAPVAATRPLGEAVRWVACIVWVVMLALWIYVPILYLIGNARGGTLENSLIRVAAVLQGSRPLWYAGHLAAVGVAVAFYVFSLRRARTATASGHGTRAARRIQLVGILTIAIAWIGLLFRILPIEPLIGFARLPPVLADAVWEYGSDAPIRWHYAAAGALVVAVVTLVGWSLVPRTGPYRRRLASLVVTLLGVGVAADLLVVPGLPAGMPETLRDLRPRTEIERALLTDHGPRDFAERWLARYFVTHDDRGNPVRWRDVQRNELPAWSDAFDRYDFGDPGVFGYGDPGRFYSRFRCELCQLPGANVWTTEGLSVRLSSLPARDAEATRIIEIPRHGDAARLFGPDGVTLSDDVLQGELPSAIAGSDRVVLKVDSEISAPDVVTWLAALGNGGVRRVDLAVVPHGTRRLSDRPPVVRQEPTDGAIPEYVPTNRPRREFIKVKKFRPPPPLGAANPSVPVLWCGELYDLDYRERFMRYELDAPDSLPERVSIAVEPDATYGDLVGLLQGAIAGGADEIVFDVGAPEEATAER